MPSVTTSAWEADYPEGWVAERDEESVQFYDRDASIGTVQITCLCSDEEVTQEDLQDLAQELVDAGRRPMNVHIGPLTGLMFRYYDGEEAWREWFLATDNCAFYITYDCPRAAEGAEDEAVVEIIESLRLKSE